MSSLSALDLPAATAWFRFRAAPDAPAHLGVVRPGPSDATDPLAATRFEDLGPLDPVAELERGRLTAGDLTTRTGVAMDAPRWFDVPIPRPSKILCLGKNFAAHAAEFGAEVPDEPIVFTKLVDTLLPHGETIRLPHWVETRIDHEIELAVVIGGGTQPLKYPASAADTRPWIAGYTIFNDVTARRMQGDDRSAHKPWLRCKSFDTFGPCGPWVVPADGFDVGDREIGLRVGSEPRQCSRTSLMVVGIEAALEYLARHTTLRAGDLVAMGTPEGVGPLQHGDEVVGWIEGLGRLINAVAREPAPH